MKSKATMSLLILLGAMQFSIAQQPAEKLSLRDCIQYSLKNNPTNIIFRNEIATANQKKIEALSGYLPQINGQATWDDNLQRQTTVIPGAAFGSPTDVKVQFGNQYNLAVSVQADQTIYDQTLISGFSGIKPNSEAAELKKLKNDDDLMYNTASAYYRLMTVKEQVKLLAQNEKKFSEIHETQKLLFDRGVITKVDYDRVRVGLNNIISQKKIAETNVELITNQLKNAMGMPLEQKIELIDSISVNIENEVPKVDGFDVKNTWDFQIQTKNIILQGVQLKRAKAAYAPTLGFYGRYGGQSFSNDFSESFKNWFGYSSIGLKMLIPIFDGLRKSSQVKQNALLLSNATQNLKLNENGLKLQFENASTQLMSSYTNFQLNKENLDLAKEVFENTSLQYEKGVANLSDLINADYSLKEAQTNYLTSMINYLVAKIDIEKSKGTLKQYFTQL
jgi:outer membrane protein